MFHQFSQSRELAISFSLTPQIVVYLLITTFCTQATERIHGSVPRKIFWVNDLLVNKQGRVYFDVKNRNFGAALLVPFYDSIYVIANRTTLLQLKNETLRLIESYDLETNAALVYCKQFASPQKSCTETNSLYIPGTLLISETRFPLVCYAHRITYVANQMTKNQPTMCSIPKVDLTDKSFMLQGIRLLFDEEASPLVLLSVKDYTYIGGMKDNHLVLQRTATLQLNGRQPPNLIPTLETDPKRMMFGKGAFIGSFESQDAVYFVLRETEQQSATGCGHVKLPYFTYTRLVRVCKNDPGGSMEMSDEKGFGTIAKATLECKRTISVQEEESYYDSSELESEYYYNFGVDGQWNNELNMLFVLYHSPRGGPKGSAVCAYQLDEIEAAFKGNAAMNDTRNPFPNICSALKNKTPLDEGLLNRVRMFSFGYSLRKERVQSWQRQPILLSNNELWRRILIQAAPTLPDEPHQTGVIYVLSEDRLRIDGYVTTLSKDTSNIPVNVNSPIACPYDTLHLDKHDEHVNDMKLNTVAGEPHILILTNQRVLQLSLYHCSSGVRNAPSRSLTPNECHSDPYCSWVRAEQKCKLLRIQKEATVSWDRRVPFSCQRVTPQNPFTDLSESGWMSCHVGNDNSHCQCQITHGKLEIKNCSVDGGWSEWSNWTACSEGCGQGSRYRSRTCTNPPPQFDGKPCPVTEPSKEYAICNSQSENCNELRTSQLDGWSAWSEWDACSNVCGPGQQHRKRICHGSNCIGSDFNTRYCYGTYCPSVSEQSTWTPWLQPVHGQGQSVRIKLICDANQNTLSSSDAGISHILMEERTCNSDGNVCSTPTSQGFSSIMEGRWTEWTSWSPCNRTCDGGMQTRTRQCLPSGTWCLGVAEMVRWCNTQPCQKDLYWTTWSDWTPCDATSCNKEGVQYRRRTCTGSGNQCYGPTQEQRTCVKEDCRLSGGNSRHWMSWSTWSQCDAAGFQTRRRVCSLCSGSGSNQEYQSCTPESTPEGSSSGGPTNHAVIGYLVVTFLVGFLSSMCLIVMIVHIIKCCRRPKRSETPVTAHHRTRDPSVYTSAYNSCKPNNLSLGLRAESLRSNSRYEAMDTPVPVKELNIHMNAFHSPGGTSKYQESFKRDMEHHYENSHLHQQHTSLTSSSNPSEANIPMDNDKNEKKARAGTPPDSRETPPLPPKNPCETNVLLHRDQYKFFPPNADVQHHLLRHQEQNGSPYSDTTFRCPAYHRHLH